jgi:7-carboxy-7-deazaguanine synthase
MKISEVFQSIQGEGRLVGTPSIFIRTSICNLRCWWCDTPYTSWNPEFFETTIDDLVKQVKRLAKTDGVETKHVVITGGEPFLQQRELAELCDRLSAEGFHITVETNATVFVPVTANLISMSPKLLNSIPTGNFQELHEKYRLRPEVIAEFLQKYDDPPQRDVQFKFVIDAGKDVEEVTQLELEIPIPKEKILLMPQARERQELVEKSGWLKGVCNRHGYGFGQRLHIELFGSRRGV